MLSTEEMGTSIKELYRIVSSKCCCTVLKLADRILSVCQTRSFFCVAKAFSERVLSVFLGVVSSCCADTLFDI